jgi:hypothetical protein
MSCTGFSPRTKKKLLDNIIAMPKKKEPQLDDTIAMPKGKPAKAKCIWSPRCMTNLQQNTNRNKRLSNGFHYYVTIFHL